MVTTNSKKIKKLVDDSAKIRTDVSLIVLELQPVDLIEVLNNLTTEMNRNRIIQLAKGENMVSFVCDDPLALMLSKEYSKRVIFYKKNLAAITVSCPNVALDTPGILAYIFQKLANSKINVLEVISCHTDVSFIIKRSDAIKARNVLGKLI